MSQILGLLFAVILAVPMIARFAPIQKSGNDMIMEAAAAKSHATFADAVAEYVKGKYSTILSTATATSPITISAATLQANGYLDPGFNGKNAFGQTMLAQILQPSAGNLQVVVSSAGGSTLKDKQAAEMAAMVSAVGANAGIVPLNDSGIFASGAASIYGSYGTFTASNANYGIAGGRVASLYNYSNGQLTGSYLYRNAVPGQAQLNQMNTSLDMNGNSIAHVNTITATTANTTTVNATTGNVATVNATTANVSAQANVGKVQLNDVVAAGWGCAPNGLVSRDGAGQVLSCQNGIFTVLGGGIKDYRTFEWRPGYGTFGTGLYYLQWFCAVTHIGGKWAGGGENVQTYVDGGSLTWLIDGTSSSDNSGAYGTITCVKLAG